jgi:hypothetical protein
MTVTTTSEKLPNIAADALVVGQFAESPPRGPAEEFNRASGGLLTRLLEAKEITGMHVRRLTEELRSWGVEADLVTMPFKWDADAWYHLKLRVENLANGSVRVRGKAWPTGQPEPAAWMIDKTDPIGNRQGAPGFFVDAEFGAYLDNLKIYANQ